MTGGTSNHIITTAEELDALPKGSVVLTTAGAAFIKYDADLSRWLGTGSVCGFGSDDIELPATVIHLPKQCPPSNPTPGTVPVTLRRRSNSPGHAT